MVKTQTNKVYKSYAVTGNCTMQQINKKPSCRCDSRPDRTASQQTSNQRLLLNIITYNFEIFGSKGIRVTTWSFGVTRRHRSCVYSTRCRPFSIGGPLDPSLYL